MDVLFIMGIVFVSLCLYLSDYSWRAAIGFVSLCLYLSEYSWRADIVFLSLCLYLSKYSWRADIVFLSLYLYLSEYSWRADIVFVSLCLYLSEYSWRADIGLVGGLTGWFVQKVHLAQKDTREGWQKMDKYKKIQFAQSGPRGRVADCITQTNDKWKLQFAQKDTRDVWQKMENIPKIQQQFFLKTLGNHNQGWTAENKSN